MNINLDSARDTLCKNILIYGYCKFENKGCAFKHQLSGSARPGSANSASLKSEEKSTTTNGVSSISTPGSANGKEKKKFNFNTPSFQPSVGGLSSKFAGLSPKLDDIPTFVPNDASTASAGPASAPPSAAAHISTTSAPGSSTSGNSTADSSSGGKKFNISASAFTPSFDSVSIQSPQPAINNPYAASSATTPQSMTNLPGNDMFYQPNAASISNYPLNYHLYAPPPPPRLSIPLPGHQVISNNMFIPNDLRESIQKKNEETMFTLGRTNLPDNVNVYHSLIPLDMEYKSSVWQVNSAIYKVFSNQDGNAYVLRKIDHESLLSITDKLPFKQVEKWKSISNSNVVKLYDCFTTIAFGGNVSQLCLVYDYYPGAMTLTEQHFTRKLGGKVEPVTTDLVWCYIIQITNALLAIHAKKLCACSSLDLSKIIVTGKGRIKLGSVGVSDILQYDQNRDFDVLQKQDFKQFGRIVTELVVLLLPPNLRYDPAEGLSKLKAFQQYVDLELVEVIEELSSDNFDLDKFNQRYLASKMIKMIDSLQDSRDYVENQLGSELENARLFRLISKINFVLDNPKYNWKENERTYLIKLFHDYIFHQVDDANKPVVDLSRVLVKLNKLDCGIDEKFMLITPNDKSSILVSYKEIRDIIDSTFRDLTK